jgi:uncharacterized protein (DUF927 family)
MSAGNSRMVFAIATAFGASLLELLGEESDGFHLRGASSMGRVRTPRQEPPKTGHPFPCRDDLQEMEATCSAPIVSKDPFE